MKQNNKGNTELPGEDTRNHHWLCKKPLGKYFLLIWLCWFASVHDYLRSILYISIYMTFYLKKKIITLPFSNRSKSIKHEEKEVRRKTEVIYFLFFFFFGNFFNLFPE